MKPLVQTKILVLSRSHSIRKLATMVVCGRVFIQQKVIIFCFDMELFCECVWSGNYNQVELSLCVFYPLTYPEMVLEAWDVVQQCIGARTNGFCKKEFCIVLPSSIILCCGFQNLLTVTSCGLKIELVSFIDYSGLVFSMWMFVMLSITAFINPCIYKLYIYIYITGPQLHFCNISLILSLKLIFTG